MDKESSLPNYLSMYRLGKNKRVHAFPLGISTKANVNRIWTAIADHNRYVKLASEKKFQVWKSKNKNQQMLLF